MSAIKVVGMDPSMSNWGIAVGALDVARETLEIHTLDRIAPVLPKGKQVRQSAKDIAAARQLMEGCQKHLEGAQAVFVEVPYGSNSIRSAVGRGICTGVLGAIQALGIGYVELTPDEIKLAGHGTKTATKAQMIEWAMATHPEAPWPTYQRSGQSRVSSAQAEHMADAVAAIRAGLKSPEFHRLLPVLRAA